MNVSKTNYMSRTPSAREASDEITLQINGQQIERVTETKQFGVILDRKLTFKSHIDYISNKIAKCIELAALLPGMMTTLYHCSNLLKFYLFLEQYDYKVASRFQKFTKCIAIY